MPPKNIFSNGRDGNRPEELVEVLAAGRETRIERIVSRGHSSPPGFWYDQERTEFVFLVEGEAQILFSGDERPTRLRAGDWLVIPPHRRHRVEWTDPDRETVWLAVHY